MTPKLTRPLPGPPPRKPTCKVVPEPVKTPLVRMPNGNWVNPQHVTCIELVGLSPRLGTRLQIRDLMGRDGDNFRFDGDIRDELAKLLNQQP